MFFLQKMQQLKHRNKNFLNFYNSQATTKFLTQAKMVLFVKEGAASNYFGSHNWGM
jgi:hypothetical protein